MQRSRLLLWIASVLAGTTALLVVLGVVYNLLLVVLAIPFGLAAYFLWFDATGRLARRVRRRQRNPARQVSGRSATSGRGNRAGSANSARNDDAQPTQSQARDILGVAADDDEETIRRAYRERVKDVHPDAAGGSEETFKLVTAAYHRLKE